jgi:ornithine cyclodeaminase/alanine dehydrogenase-like protein (mu-crystallin family)
VYAIPFCLGGRRMLVLGKKEIESIYTMKECLNDVETAFRYDWEQKTVTPVRLSVLHKKYDADMLYMPSYIEAIDYTAVKVVSIFPHNKKQGLKTLQGTILLTEAKTGKHVAVMDASLLTIMRTGASSGVATKYLAREDAGICAVLGCGAQAAGQVQAIMEVREIERLILWNRTTERALEFKRVIEAMYPYWDGVIDVAESPNDAVREADIVVCSTKSTEPLFSSSFLQPGTHINAIGAYQPYMQEFGADTLRLSNKVVVDTKEGALHEAGDLITPIENGEWKIDQLYGEIGEIIAGQKTGREHAQEITLYKSVGIAYLDTMVAAKVYEKAKKLGIGTEIEL